MDIVRLAPQLHIQLPDVLLMELTLIQSLQFNLFVPTAIEFAHAFIAQLKEACADLANHDNLLFEPMHEWSSRYIKYLESDFSFIENLQSEKAFVVVQCALARWSIM